MGRPPILALALALAAARAEAVETVRLGVASGPERIVASGDGLAFRPLGAEAEAQAVPGGRLEVTVAGARLRVGGEEGATGIVLTAPGTLRIGDRVLAGEVEVTRGTAGLDVVEVLPMEAYVAGVVAGEMPTGFPPEALKAQAVAARTYALVRKVEAQAAGRRVDLGITVLAQVYAGAAPGEPARAAAEATAGEVLVFGHEPVEAYFHSVCGGRTESGAAALGRDLPYLQPVECRFCAHAPRARWTVSISAADLARAAGLPGRATAVRVTARTGTGRAARLEIVAGGRRAALSGVELRQRLGYGRLPSLAFEVRGAGGAFAFEGRGLGHGAGLCQWGAAGMAREGKGYREILAHYYPGTEIFRMY